MGEKGSVMTKPVSKTKRHKLGENKTIMIPRHLQDVPELPEVRFELPEQGEKKGLGRFRLFKFGRKEKAERKEPETDVKQQATYKAEEPEFLKEIDLGHARKVEPELVLWLNDGRVVRSLEELLKAFKTMKSRTFYQHSEKKDVSGWVRDIIGDAQLAAELAAAKTKKDAVKILENHRKKSEQKKEKPSRKTEPKVIESKAEGEKNLLEIEEAIESAHRSEIEKPAATLKEKEERLKEKERLLELEEQHINRKKIEIANRRYRLLKERGEIEKEKFEQILKKRALSEWPIPGEKAGMPQLELTADYTKEKIRGLIGETRKALDQGRTEEAKQLVEELKAALEFTEIAPKESKKLEYEVLELEADLKLATLV